MKFCRSCGHDRQDGSDGGESDFYVRRRRGRVELNPMCKFCQKDHHERHYAETGHEYIRRAKNRAQNLHDLSYSLKSNPCTDCGKEYGPWVMEWDHRDPSKKEDSISNLVRRQVNVKRIMDEIQKCDLVCANCHREREHSRWQERRGSQAERQCSAKAPP